MIDVGAIEEFPNAAIRIVRVEGRDLGILRWDDSWYAARNICPHLGAPVCTGQLQPYLGQDSGASEDLVVDRARPVITCPWHHWEFDLTTGRCLVGNERLQTYPVEIADGRVMVAIRHKRAET